MHNRLYIINIINICLFGYTYIYYKYNTTKIDVFNEYNSERIVLCRSIQPNWVDPLFAFSIHTMVGIV